MNNYSIKRKYVQLFNYEKITLQLIIIELLTVQLVQ
jgi:hypothetical protein